MTKSTIEPRFIAIEGAIGAGKTSLVSLLGEQYGARLILENTDSNPFISKFYEDKEAYSFQTQVFFFTEPIQPVYATGTKGSVQLRGCH